MLLKEQAADADVTLKKNPKKTTTFTSFLVVPESVCV